MEIAIFGGSFDPPHLGHLLCAAQVLLTEPVGELWMTPVFAHPFQKPLAAPYQARIAMCEAAAHALGNPRLRVSRAEEELARAGQGEGRTVDLLEHLHAQRPADRFALVMGSDILQETGQWKRWDRVRELARIIRVQRQGHPLPELPAATLPEISSTELRVRLRRPGREREELRALIPAAVLEVIDHQGLYR